MKLGCDCPVAADHKGFPDGHSLRKHLMKKHKELVETGQVGCPVSECNELTIDMISSKTKIVNSLFVHFKNAHGLPDFQIHDKAKEEKRRKIHNLKMKENRKKKRNKHKSKNE